MNLAHLGKQKKKLYKTDLIPVNVSNDLGAHFIAI